MKKFLLVLVLCLSLSTALALVPDQADAKPPGEYFEGKAWICILDYDPSHTNIWVTENTSHGRNGYQWAFGGSEEMGYGPKFNVVNWNVNLKKGEGVTWGTFQDDVLDEAGNWKGAWIGTYTGKLSLAESPAYDIFGNPIYLTVGKAVAYGTDAFAGMQLRANFWQEAYDPDQVPNPCNAVFNPDGTFPYPLPMHPVIQHIEGYMFMGD